jgi:hypothetical protein
MKYPAFSPRPEWGILRFLALIIGIALFPPLTHSPLYGMDWPSPDADLIQNFGWNDNGRPRLGAVFAAGGSLRAAERGELLFVRRKNDAASGLPAPLGDWIAIDHGDGLISIYSRFENRETGRIPNDIGKNTPLGTAGISGWSNQEGFYFSLFDRKERRWVNPSMIITPFRDTTAPVIQSVKLKNAGGEFFDPALTRNISQGRYTVSVQAADTLDAAGIHPLAPHRIVCSVNGSEIGSLNFETYSTRDGVLMVYRNGLMPVKQVYAPYPAFEVGEVWLNRGQVSLEIIAQDIAGNSRSVLYRLTIE